MKEQKEFERKKVFKENDILMSKINERNVLTVNLMIMKPDQAPIRLSQIF